MAKDRDRALNPAAAQRKLEKQKALKKGKAAVAAQRTERYAHRNPRRLESTIADLRALRDRHGGQLSARDQRQLEDAERDVARVRKAREVLGDRAPTFDNRGSGPGRGGLGKRRREGEGKWKGQGRGHSGSEGETDTETDTDTDESVRRIPWPRDTPPPIPRQRVDRAPRHSTDANAEPLGAQRRLQDRDGGEREEQALPGTTTLAAKPAPKTTYEGKAVVRDLRKEATARFIPAAVKRKIDATKGVGGRLLEEDEVERLEKEGYGAGGKTGANATGSRRMVVDAAPHVESSGKVDTDRGEEARRLEEEEERFKQEMAMVEAEEMEDELGSKGVRVEEVSDEDL